MSDIEIGQVLSLRLRFNNSGTVSKGKHPYLVISIDNELGIIEVVQFDTLEGKEHKAMMKSNKVVFCEDPHETVIDKNSFVQLDNIFKLENFPELSKFRRQPDKLSDEKLSGVITAYHNYHNSYEIDENKNVFMNKEELLNLN